MLLFKTQHGAEKDLHYDISSQDVSNLGLFSRYFLGNHTVYTADHCLACSARFKISFIFTVRVPEEAQVVISFDSLLSQYLHLPSLLKAIPQKLRYIEKGTNFLL